MKYSLVIMLLLFGNSIFAQLTVINDAYIFANDTFFYVEEDINLRDSNSTIYLRNEAQILQGDETTFNRGLGVLSIYQEGNVNQWSYNYWCSPVGGNLTSLASNNPFRINQLDDPLLGSPDLKDSSDAVFTSAFEGTAEPLVISDRWLWSFVSSGQYNDWIYLGADNNLDPGLGFTMKGNGTGTTGNTTYDFRGKPNNGTITNPIAEGLFTLIGNPYPSAIDAVALIHDADNANAIVDQLYYWEQSGTVTSHVLQDYIGGYATYTIDSDGSNETSNFALFFTYDEQDNTTPVLTPPPGGQAQGTKIARRYIPIGQGFLVEGLTGNTIDVVTVRNSHRAFIQEGTESVFFRAPLISNSSESATTQNQIQYQDNGLSIVPDDYKRFRVNVDFTVGENQYTRQLVLNFHESATLEHDRGLELKLPQNYDSDAYFMQDEKSMSGLAFPFSEELRIPLVVDIEEQQPLRFRIFDIQNFEDSQGIYIHDTYNNNYTNLRNAYYELNIDPGHYTERFEIVFTTENVLNSIIFELEHLSIVQNNELGTLQIFNPNKLDLVSIKIIDITGRIVLTGDLTSSKILHTVQTDRMESGAYVVSLRTNSNGTKTKKIIVKN